MQQKFNHKNQHGFTLMEVIVSTAIFLLVISGLLGLFTQTLQINRRVQAVRELVQGTRAFTETISREVRNGRIDYQSWAGDADCSPDNYSDSENQTLALLRNNGDKICFYLAADGTFNMKKQGSGASEAVFTSNRFRIIPDTFRFYVRPTEDPSPDCDGDPSCISSLPEIQPLVTMVAQFELDSGPGPSSIINYQTTISTDVYDIPKSE